MDFKNERSDDHESKYRFRDFYPGRQDLHKAEFSLSGAPISLWHCSA
jgi:hypothetical protein